jgi:hypothetical protein
MLTHPAAEQRLGVGVEGDSGTHHYIETIDSMMRQ